MSLIPLKKYRDKVRKRLEITKELLGDKVYLERYFRRAGLQDKQELRNKIIQVEMLLNKDVPALLDALDQISSGRVVISKFGD